MINSVDISRQLAKVEAAMEANQTKEVYATLLSCVDLTTLTPCDTESSVEAFAQRAVSFYQEYPELENVASLCVYPPFVERVGLVVDGTPMRITSVAGGFPSSQTFLEVKALEIAMAIESGADEIDVVLSVGKILEGNYEEAAGELRMLRSETGDDELDHVTLKVILETGELHTPEKIYAASMVAIESGADFIKTSSGKTPVSATPEAVIIMCQAISDHYNETGRMVGIKVAGGVRTALDGALYYTIVKEMLGAKWLNPKLFRIGASSAANNLLNGALGREVNYF